MPKELLLKEMEEVVGAFRGITTNRLFTAIVVGNDSIMMETERPNTKAIVGQLQKIGKGAKIGIIRIGGTLRVRRSEENK